MKYKIYGYDRHTNSSKCTDENGTVHRMDFLVSGCLLHITSAEDLIGKTLEARAVFPFVELAEGVRIVEEGNAEEISE